MFARRTMSGRLTSFVPAGMISGRTLGWNAWLIGIARSSVAPLGGPILLLLRSAFLTLAAALVLFFGRHGSTDTPGGVFQTKGLASAQPTLIRLGNAAMPSASAQLGLP